MDRATRAYPMTDALARVRDIQNMLLFIDDDLRETALALHNVEQFLVDTLGLLERPVLRREDVSSLASDTAVLDHVDMLSETLETLRRRLARLAASLR